MYHCQKIVLLINSHFKHFLFCSSPLEIIPVKMDACITRHPIERFFIYLHLYGIQKKKYPVILCDFSLILATMNLKSNISQASCTRTFYSSVFPGALVLKTNTYTVQYTLFTGCLEYHSQLCCTAKIIYQYNGPTDARKTLRKLYKIAYVFPK